ncbi:MAG: bifunctional phosphoglucose/phosphomannose isomerase, partial [Ignavibacteriae bacterium]
MKITELKEKFDLQNQFQVLVDSYKQIEFAWENKFDLMQLQDSKYNLVVLVGMGGSAISGDLITNYLANELKIPFIVNRSYSLPDFVNENSLVIISSYSGNTEETLSVFEEALKRKCKIAAITSGGQVKKICDEKKLCCINIPIGYQPRYALGLSFFSLLKLLQQLGIIKNQDSTVNQISSLWKKKGEEYSIEENRALSLALELTGFLPIIYSAACLTSAVGYRFKCQLNENSKLHAFSNIIPEMNHNEIIGWETFEEKKLFTKLITISDPDYHPQIKKRFKITSELAKKSGVE